MVLLYIKPDKRKNSQKNNNNLLLYFGTNWHNSIIYNTVIKKNINITSICTVRNPSYMTLIHLNTQIKTMPSKLGTDLHNTDRLFMSSHHPYLQSCLCHCIKCYIKCLTIIICWCCIMAYLLKSF